MQHLLDGSALAAMLNHRQIALLISMRKHPDLVYTIASHSRSHRVTYQTARTDLLGLAELGLVATAKHGRAFVFSLARDFDDRLRKLSKPGTAPLRPPLRPHPSPVPAQRSALAEGGACAGPVPSGCPMWPTDSGRRRTSSGSAAPRR